MNKEVIEKALKQFKREDILDSPYNKECGLDIDSNIEVFLTTREMVSYYKQQQELERYKNIIKNIKEEIELYIDTVIDHLETNNEEINFELRNKCRAMREIKSEILEIIEKELKGE